ncbi:MAG: integral rane sensor signal transduction histidine kinase [Solirubrobacterales bacterium]|nr:integral rane sensor signal transduction histidine kinase [Solirubrobacterales bacterium]
MRSLRARLLGILLGLTAAGMLIAGAITYTEQRSFLLNRLDQQVESARSAVDDALGGQGPGSAGAPADRGGRERPRPRIGGGPNLGPPAGTYGQLRTATGAVTKSVTLDYGQSSSDAKPNLPASIPLDRLITVSGSGDNAPRYRVQASREGNGSILVVAVPLAEVDQTLHRLLTIEGIVIVSVLLLLGIVGWIVVRVGLLPLDRMGHTAGAIAGGDLSARVDTTDPRTEVGRLGIALNRMLERLERAFAERQASEDRLRRFLADASHELRTPLASIRGYAELFRMGAAREPAETERAMQRIEDEAARMGVLVEDLLTLARLDEVADAPHVALQLRPLAADAVDDARATAPDRDITLITPGDPGLISGDAHQLRQVLANLVRNALVHTPAGTAVEIGVARDGNRVRLIVRDHGPGLPAGEADAVFDRFWRSEGGRERGRAGAGLGLAIVAAIVEAHGGDVRAADAPGGGAEFTVELPAL